MSPQKGRFALCVKSYLREKEVDNRRILDFFTFFSLSRRRVHYRFSILYIDLVSMSNICIIVRDTRIGDSLVNLMSPRYHRVWHEQDIFMVRSIIVSKCPDVLCIDGATLGTSLSDLVSSIREISTIPILFFLDYEQLGSMESCFVQGNIDYVLKPYHPDEIHTRIDRLLFEKREVLQGLEEHNILSITEDLSVDLERSVLTVGGKEHRLSKTLRYLLEMLLEKRKKVVPHEYIYEKLWGDYDTLGPRREIRSHTKRLRALLGKYGECLINVKAQGYMLDL